jgi:nucleoside-diphosphate-sugar epimerase
MANAQFVISLASRGVRSSVLRLPPTVHGEGDNGFVPTQIGIAREKGVSGYVGDGSHRWPAVHRSDAARLFRLALEQAPAGTTLHAVGDEGVPVRDIAELIGRHLDVPVSSIALEDAFSHFGWLGGPLSIDAPSSAEITQRLVGWRPTGPALIDDLDKGHYFDAL